MTLGEILKEHRKRNKYSQEKIAEFVGVSRHAVTKWESNQTAPSTDNLLRLAHLYNISMNELVVAPIEPLTSKPEKHKGFKLRKFAIVWGIIIGLLIIVSIMTRDCFTLTSPIWELMNLMLFIIYTAVGIYIVCLLIKALNKYLNTP